ncbi:hypothetical protein ABEX25_21890 [Paenibacillus thiaminolyticus]|uniref:hypothetical protein n=1 Tax=Paenibacillus thiaminolyticus TaxID=49283 RepID=UPI003D2C469B
MLVIDLVITNLVIPGLLTLWVWKSSGSSLAGSVTCLLTTASYFIFFWIGEFNKAMTLFGALWTPLVLYASYRLIKKTKGAPLFPQNIRKLAALSVMMLIASIFIYVNLSSLQSSFYQKQLETEHFMVYNSKAHYAEAEQLANRLERNYGRVTEALQVEPSTKTKVIVFPSQLHFIYSLGQFSNFWSLGVFNEDTLFILSPKNRPAMYNSSVHEFIHIILSHIDSKRPTWLEEGVANYFGKTDLNALKVLPPLISSGQIPSFDEIDGPAFVYRHGYPYSYTIVEFLVIEYGYEKLNDFIRHPEDYKRIFGVSKSELQALWVKYLKGNYS